MAGILEIENVYTAYDKADVLQGVSLSVNAGKITCLLGSNGSGKTTLVRSVLGLTPARSGRVASCRDFADFSAARGAPGSTRRYHVGRRAGDDIHRAWADVRAQASAHR